MLTVLAAQWGLMLFRGALTVLFGALALLWPGLSLAVLVILFGSYALLNGFATLMMALTSRGVPGVGSLLAEGVVAIAAGAVTLLYPGLTAFALLITIATWATIAGIASIVTAASLRGELSGEWPLPFAGALSLILGALLLLQRNAGALALAWMIGLYAILAGASQIALALRMRQLAQEIAHA